MAENPPPASAVLARSMAQMAAAYAEAMRPLVEAMAAMATRLGASLEPTRQALAELGAKRPGWPDAADHSPGDPPW